MLNKITEFAYALELKELKELAKLEDIIIKLNERLSILEKEQKLYFSQLKRWKNIP